MTTIGTASSHSVDCVLSRLEGVRRVPSGWEAKCPAHDDRRASLSIAVAEDGRVLLKCHAGCETASVVNAIRLTMSDLFPPRSGGNGSGAPRIMPEYHPGGVS